MPRITAHIAHGSGIPLGGLGTGSVEVRPDGYFHDWQIFNLGDWAPQQPEPCRQLDPEMGADGLQFFCRMTRPDGRPIVRRLGMTRNPHPYQLSWAKSVPEIVFDGRYPVASLEYRDEDLPASVTARMFSPMVPHDARTSGTPGFYAAFTLRNDTLEPVTVSLLGLLKNPIARGAADRKLVNTVARDGDVARLTMRSEADPPCKATLGSLSLAVAGGEASFISGMNYVFAYMAFQRMGGVLGNALEHFLPHWRETGKLPDTDAERSPADLLTVSEEQIDAFDEARCRAELDRLKQYAFTHWLIARVSGVDPDLLDTRDGMIAALKDLRRIINSTFGADRRVQAWGNGALASQVEVPPGGERQVVFSLAWHFPHHLNGDGAELGHVYDTWFADADQVSRFLTSSYDRLAPRVAAFAHALYDTTLPEAMPDAWSAQLSTLAKSTWWTRDGKFGVWEGLGCCGFHTTDITYQGSFNLIALYPELQLGQMEMGAACQDKTGRVHHLFRPDLNHVDDQFDRVDMNQQFVLLVCRDYLWTGDLEYVRRLWDHVVRAMDYIQSLDGDGDGLPDRDTRRNTYDLWNMRGVPSYIASLWMSALLAAIRLADEIGDDDRAGPWRSLLETARESFDEKLWNGEYYSLWVDGDQRDECCMCDQVDGEWFTRLIGLGNVLGDDRVRAAVEASFRYNFDGEAGLLNASYPPARRRQLSTYKNPQADSPWTGIEYLMVSMMLEYGLVGEAAAVVANVDERYRRAGRIWDHMECGGHYYRAMSSWAVLLSAVGFKLDAPRGLVSFSPTVDTVEFRAPWFAPTGWGRYQRTGRSIRIFCESGTLRFARLALGEPAAGDGVRLNGRAVAMRHEKLGGRECLAFDEPVELSAGDRLEIARAGGDNEGERTVPPPRT